MSAAEAYDEIVEGSDGVMRVTGEAQCKHMRFLLFSLILSSAMSALPQFRPRELEVQRRPSTFSMIVMVQMATRAPAPSASTTLCTKLQDGHPTVGASDSCWTHHWREASSQDVFSDPPPPQQPPSYPNRGG